MGYQRVIVCGRLGRDPESRVVGEQSVCRFSVAVGERRKVKGEWQEVTEWFEVEAWGRTGETAQAYLAKGRECIVDGRLRTETFQGKDGTEKKRATLVADVVRFVGPRPNEEPASGDAAPASDAECPF